MYPLSTIISEVYQSYQDLARQHRIQLNLDLSDQSGSTSHPEKVKAILATELTAAIARAPHGQITITLKHSQIILRDNGAALSKTLCRQLSQGCLTVTSRVGFGTKVIIDPQSI